MRPIKVYVSAKLDHASEIAGLKIDGFHFNARWPHMAEAGRQNMKPVVHWQQENYDDIIAADFFALLVHPADVLKGSIQETGYAMAFGKKIWIAAQITAPVEDNWGVEVKIDGTEQTLRVPNKGIMPWALQPNRIKIVPSLVQACTAMRQYVGKDRVLDASGAELPLTQEF